MAGNLVLVDSCVFIKAFRKDALAQNHLSDIVDRTAYSVITQLELLVGARSAQNKTAINNLFAAYYGIPLNAEISKKAIYLMRHYVSGNRHLSVPDCLIAATSLTTGFPLLTYNKKDFAFIESLTFYE